MPLATTCKRASIKAAQSGSVCPDSLRVVQTHSYMDSALMECRMMIVSYKSNEATLIVLVNLDT